MHNSSNPFARYVILALLSSIAGGTLSAVTFKITDLQPIDAHSFNLTVQSELAPEEYLYADYLSFSVDSPQLQLSQWKSSVEATPHFDAAFNQSKRILKDNPVFTMTITNDKNELNAHLLITFYTNKTKQFVQNSLQLAYPLALPVESESSTVTSTAETPNAPANLDSTAPAPSSAHSPSLADRLSNLATSTQSWWFRIALAFLLGLLLSLTPCIYPMVPITVGILQAQGSKSLSSNFLLALAYSAGLATTFAFLGLGAAFAGHMVGALLSNPIVIGVIVVLLIYVALSLFGLYELYIPRSLRNRGQMGKASYVSAFVFGAASGTVASPCLSPGLILMLTLVATLKSVPLGFILLFAFGFGLSVPLLIIGTFSSSLALLPQAGMWMLEINYLFGFMLFAMALYFLQSILAWPLILALGALLSIIAALFYFKRAAQEQSHIRSIHRALALICIACAAFLMVKSAASLLVKKAAETMPMHATEWLSDYAQGLAEAQKQNKKLFVDISAPMCSACEAVEKKIFSKQQVLQELSYFVAVKLNIANMQEDARTQLMHTFNIMGAPTLLLIDPTTEKVIARWSSELAERTAASFISELAQYR